MPHKTLQIPFRGAMDLDSPYEVVPNGFHTDARNMVWRGIEGNMRGENTPGTSLISNADLPAGTNCCIGGIYDQVNARIFYANCNSNGNHAWYIIYIKSLTVVTLMDDGAVLNFDAAHPLASVNILYGDQFQGDVLYYLNSQDVPSQINIQQALNGSYGAYRTQYIEVAKQPPDIPPGAVYVDDATFTVNNVHNQLFKFKTVWRFNNQDKSVTSSQSVEPIPIKTGDTDISADPTKNCKIALIIQTGPPNVKKLEICGARNLGVVFSDFFSIDILDKAELGIPDDDIMIYYFANDKAYLSLDVPYSILSYDKVPIYAGAQELLNGNVPGYAKITENYDRVPLSTSSCTPGSETQRRTQMKVLFQVAQDGESIGTAGDPIHAVVVGTVEEANYFRIYTTNNTINYQALAGEDTTDVINGLAAAAVIAGFTVISSDANNLYIQKAAQQLVRYYQSSNIIPNVASTDTTFVYDWWSRYAYGLVYFDAKGRTNGAMITSGFTIQTPAYSESSGTVNIPTVSASIYNQPPIWAAYYQWVRTKNLSKSTILQWISDRTFKDDVVGDDGHFYAYISIENLNRFIQDNPSSSFLAYGFSPNDRIRFIKLYPTGGLTSAVIETDKDYEIQGSVLDPVINGQQMQGQFIKIYLPTTDADFDFGIQAHVPFADLIDYSNYFIELYTPALSAAEGLNTYFEYGERKAIGNQFTSARYHQGQIQNQSTDYLTPATFLFDQGDFYLRTRSIYAGDELKYTVQEADVQELDFIPMQLDQSFNAVGWTAQSVPYAHLTGNLKDSNNWMINVTDGNAYTFIVQGDITLTAINGSTQAATLKLFSTKPDGTTSFATIADITNITAGKQYHFAIDTSYLVDAGYTKLFLMFITPDNSLQFHVNSGQFRIRDAAKLFSQLLIDPNFSDSFRSAVNSNGRPWIFDVNARQIKDGILFRYGLSYQLDTNINDSNRFYPNNFDTFDNRYGDVIRMRQHDKELRIFQYRKCGAVGVFNRWIRQDDGSNVLISTDTIITPNNIFYYAGNNGIGNQPMGLASSSFVDYFPDPVTGQLFRLSKDGLTPISDLYRVKTWSSENLPPYLINFPYQYGGYAKILGVFTNPPRQSGDYLCVLQYGIDPIAQYGIYNVGGETMAFEEDRNAFTSKFDFGPDFILNAETSLFAWYGGQAYIFNNEDDYNTFFGTKYDSIVQAVAKDPQDVKKDFTAISYNQPYPQYMVDVPVWTAPVIGDIETSTGLQSNLVTSDFNYDNGMRHAPFQKAYNPQYGIVEGADLQGMWLKMRLKNSSNKFTFISSLYVNWIIAQKNF